MDLRNSRLWREAQRKYRLSNKHVRMAGELGLDPQRLGKVAPNQGQPWKKPLGQFIEKIYFRRFKRAEPKVPLPGGWPRLGQRAAAGKNPKKKKKGKQRPMSTTKPEIAAPHKWLQAQQRHKLSDAHMHMALALGVSPYHFRTIGQRARDKHSRTLPEQLEAMYAEGGKRPPVPEEPFITALWRLGNKAWKRRIEKRYPSAAPEAPLAGPAAIPK